MEETIRQQLDQTGLFRDFDDAAKQQLVKMSRTKTFASGEVIYRIGDEATALYGVLEGAVKLLGEDREGHFFLFGVTAAGRWFGDSSALDGEPRGQTVIAAGETRVMKLLRSDLLALLTQRPELYQHFVAVFCMRLRLAGRVLEEAAFLPVSVRLGKQLLRLHKVREEHGIKLTQEELAATVGVSRQSIYRVLKNWEKEQWITMSYGDVRVAQPESIKALLE